MKRTFQMAHPHEVDGVGMVYFCLSSQAACCALSRDCHNVSAQQVVSMCLE